MSILALMHVHCTYPSSWEYDFESGKQIGILIKNEVPPLIMENKFFLLLYTVYLYIHTPWNKIKNLELLLSTIDFKIYVNLAYRAFSTSRSMHHQRDECKKRRRIDFP